MSGQEGGERYEKTQPYIRTPSILGIHESFKPQVEVIGCVFKEDHLWLLCGKWMLAGHWSGIGEISLVAEGGQENAMWPDDDAGRGSGKKRVDSVCLLEIKLKGVKHWI